ncbi:MAG TPA: hypothetical protein VE422_18740 [Terriglobia bacterium]|nr:hypothetical protein [Terriglobia bacterium]
MKRIGLLLLLFADFAFGQGTSLPAAVRFPQIAVGGDPAGANYTALLQIVNNNSVATTGHVTLYADAGSPLPALFDGQGPQSAVDISLQPGEARQIQLTMNSTISTGWMDISYSPSEALTTLILQLRSGTALLSEIGVQPADLIDAADLSVETDTSLNTGLAFANPDTVPIGVFVTLWDPSAGTRLAGTVVQLPAKGHIARFLTELFPGVAGIGQMRAELSIDSCSDTSCNFPGAAVVTTAVRLNGDQFTTIPISSDTTSGEQIRILPQVAFGGPANGLNMKTVLYFTTNVTSGVFGKADIFDNDGNPLFASADGAAPASSITFTVNGNRVSRIVLGGDETLRSGWIRLTLSGNVHLITNAVFQTFNGGSLASEASVLESPPATRGLIYVKSQSNLGTVGIAFANSQTTSNTITLQLFDRLGFPSASQNITLPPNGHLARFITEIFPQLASLTDFDGALSMRSSTAFSALALRLSSGKIATLPVASNGMYRPSITALRVTTAQRSPAQVNFEIDLTDFDSDAVTASATAVQALAGVDFGDGNGVDVGAISMDGTALLNKTSGTLKGTFQPPGVSSIPSGQRAAFYIVIADSTGNESNVVGILIQF